MARALQTRDRRDGVSLTVPHLRRSVARCAACGTHCGMRRSYFVYILANAKRGVLYVGMTNNLTRRLEQHRAKSVDAFTAKYGVIHLVYFEEYAVVDEARSRERTIKRWRRDWKFKLIEANNPDWIDLGPQLAL
jgi:putative endonuclease